MTITVHDDDQPEDEREALRWFNERLTVRVKSKPAEKGTVEHIYYNIFGVLCCHLREWNGLTSGYRVDQIELDL